MSKQANDFTPQEAAERTPRSQGNELGELAEEEDQGEEKVSLAEEEDQDDERRKEAEEEVKTSRMERIIDKAKKSVEWIKMRKERRKEERKKEEKKKEEKKNKRIIELGGIVPQSASVLPPTTEDTTPEGAEDTTAEDTTTLPRTPCTTPDTPIREEDIRRGLQEGMGAIDATKPS